MNYSIKEFFSKCDQIRRFLRIWSHLLKKSLMENLIFDAVGISNKLNFNELRVTWVEWSHQNKFLYKSILPTEFTEVCI